LDVFGGFRQVGYVKRKIGNTITQNAVIWSGSADSFVTLSPYYSAAVAIAGDQQVGFVSTSLTCSECGPTGGNYAVLWRGTPESAVVLNPVGFSSAGVADTDGVQQVGSGSSNSQPTYPFDLRQRALVWSGTRESVVDLTPDGYRAASAVAVKNGTQVGRAVVIGEDFYKAIVWHNTKESFRDLGYGVLYDTNGTTHVGSSAGANGLTHAFRWDGDSGAKFDLHTLLPEGVFRYSFATGINENGDISGWGQTPDYRSIGILWRRADAPNVAPTVFLNNPAFNGGNASFVPRGSIPLTANATDPDGAVVSVEFYVDGEMIGNGTDMGEGRYQTFWLPTTTGVHAIQVKATDNAGAISFSRLLRYNILSLPRR
jgi:hypothetical protein